MGKGSASLRVRGEIGTAAVLGCATAWRDVGEGLGSMRAKRVSEGDGEERVAGDLRGEGVG